jgi:outer membrane scaffolding protein for murein synthesis (MipA/OmpV family)
MPRYLRRTNWVISRPLSAIVSLALIASAHAQVPLADGARDLPLWEIGLVGGALSTPAYPGAAERSNRALALPFVLYRGKVLRADGASISARLFDSERVELDVGFAASLPARSDEVAVRQGMPDLNPLVEFGPRVKVLLAEPSASSRVRLEMPLRMPVELASGLRRHGLVFEPRIALEAGDSAGKWQAGASLGVMWGNARANAYFYEVGPQFATVARAAYQAESGMMMTRLGAGLSRRLSADWRVFGFARYDDLRHAANRESPLFLKGSGLSAGLGFMWTARRSRARAWE